ncbi:MAG TPA: hypothetical protein VJZ76_03030 [Thermoanaerobaculia bacterium]|nr:hypothetical protein [Thermoanaerobaculia bacterium]
MISLLHRALAGAIVVLAIAGAVRADEKDQIVELEMSIGKERARIPNDVATFEQYLRPKAQRMKVAYALTPAPPETATRVPLPDGKPSPVELVRLDLRGAEQLGDVQLFFAVMSNSNLYDLESLRLTPRSDGRVAFEARIALARWAGEAPYVLGTYRDPASMMRGRLEELRAILATIESLEERFRPRRVLNAIGAFEEAMRKKAMAVTEIRAGAETHIDGVLLGGAARAALKPALETSGFEVLRLDFTPRGDCQAFTAALRVKPHDEEEMNFASGRMFGDDRPCTAKPVPATHVAARGNGGNVTMHLRGVDAADVFLALNAATKEPFILDGSVRGRIDADFENATLAEALSALKSAGFAPIAVPAGNYTGEPISISVHGADARDVVAMLAQVTGRKLSPPPAARVSVFASDEPWDRLLAGILAVPASKEAATGNPSWWTIEPNDLTAGDLTPAGVARTAEGWIGFAYAPGRRLHVLTPNTTLGGVQIGAIDAGGVALK